jgi:hypothetical protein
VPTGLRDQVGDGPRMTEGVRRLEVDEVRDRQQRLVVLVLAQQHRQGRLGADHDVPGGHLVQVGQEHAGLGVEHISQVRVELLAPLVADERPGGLHPADAVGHLDVLSDGGEPGRYRHVVAAQLPRPPAAVPLLVRRVERLEGVGREPEILTEPAGHLRVVRDHRVELMPARHGELGGEPDLLHDAVVAGREPADRGERPLRAVEPIGVLVGLEPDVVAEPLRLLVGVGVTAHVDQEGRVVDRDAVVLVDADAVGQAQRDQALP